MFLGNVDCPALSQVVVDDVRDRFRHTRDGESRQGRVRIFRGQRSDLRQALGERFDLSFDASLRQNEGTVESGGVAAIPDTGAQLFFNAMVVGTSLLKRNDLWMLSLRSDSTLSRDTRTLIADCRLPFGRALRINPRITVAVHTPNVPDASEQTVVTPALRLLWRWKRVLIDLEAGARWSSRELPPLEADPFTPDGTEELSGGFVNLGYRLEF